MFSVPSLEVLIESLRRLPGVGPKSAQRMALHLLQYDRTGGQALGESILNALAMIRHCRLCNTFCETEVCPTCESPRRDETVLCVVETPADQWMVEQTGAFSGLYFVLMGRLSPLDGVGPKDIHVAKLIKRATNGIVSEVILATNFTQEGEATAHYIHQVLSARGVKVSRIARGVPAGAELEYTDLNTVAHALIERR